MPRIRFTFRRAARASLALFLTAPIASCENPVGPEIARQSVPFYYYQNERIYLRVDPSRLTVVPEAVGDTNRVRAVLAERDVTVDSIRPLWMENHWLVYLSGVSASRAENAARWLRLDGGVRFASAAYRIRGGSCPLYLLNRLWVQFEPAADDAEIGQLNAFSGVRNEQLVISPWGVSRSYEYPPDLAYTPLELAAYYHRQRIVEGAEPDRIDGCLRVDG